MGPARESGSPGIEIKESQSLILITGFGISQSDMGGNHATRTGNAGMVVIKWDAVWFWALILHWGPSKHPA